MDKPVALLALQETSEVAADPGAYGHDDGYGPVDFTRKAQGHGAYDQEHVRERVLEGVDLDGRKPRVAREAEYLQKAHAHLHDAAVDGDEGEPERALPCEPFGGCRGRLS